MKSWLKKLFVPHSGNDHHPHFWRNASLGVLAGIIALSEIFVFSQSFVAFTKNSYLASVLPAVVAALTNTEREANSATPLKENDLLAKAAELKAQDMAAKGYFSHTTPEGYTSWYWLEKVGYQYAHAGENLAVNFTDSKDVVDAWMRSPTHRANIVKQVYTEIGIGMAEGTYQGRPAIFVAQFFGTPGSTAPKLAVASVATTTASTSIATSSTLRTDPKPIVAVSPLREVPARATTTREISTSTIETTVATSATTSETVVAGVETDQNSAVSHSIPSPSLLSKVMSSPRNAGMFALMAIFAVVLIAFLIVLFGKRGIHHPKMAMVALAFFLMISGLLTLNTKILKDPIDIGQAGAVTTVFEE